MSDLAKVWGRRIRERRQLAGMTQVELAAKLGVDQTTVSGWELGSYTPSHQMVPRIAAAVGADISVLFEYPQVAS